MDMFALIYLDPFLPGFLSTIWRIPPPPSLYIHVVFDRSYPQPISSKRYPAPGQANMSHSIYTLPMTYARPVNVHRNLSLEQSDIMFVPGYSAGMW